MDCHRRHLQFVVEIVGSEKSVDELAMMSPFRLERFSRCLQSIANSENDLHGLWWHQLLHNQWAMAMAQARNISDLGYDCDDYHDSLHGHHDSFDGESQPGLGTHQHCMDFVVRLHNIELGGFVVEDN